MILCAKRGPARPALEALVTMTRPSILDDSITLALGAVNIHA
jgi:hypothetical protein